MHIQLPSVGRNESCFRWYHCHWWNDGGFKTTPNSLLGKLGVLQTRPDPDVSQVLHVTPNCQKKKKRCSALSWLCINTRVSLGYKCRSFAVAAAVCSRVLPPPSLGSTVCSPVVYLRLATVLKHHVFRCKTWCYLLEVSGEVRAGEGKGGLGLAQHTLDKYIQTFNLIIIIRLNH